MTILSFPVFLFPLFARIILSNVQKIKQTERKGDLNG